jgi:hypothetical protein
MPNTAKRPQATIATQRHLCLPIGGEGQEQERRPADCRYPTGWLAVMGEPPMMMTGKFVACRICRRPRPCPARRWEKYLLDCMN